ncbi:MAG: winged helix-turn-helix domain-containing protein [Kofleriaceae bacterium]
MIHVNQYMTIMSIITRPDSRGTWLLRMPATAPPAPGWTFLSNHGHVLLCVARQPDVTIRELSDQVGITERAVQRILADLVEAGYVAKVRSGRRNRYVVDRERRLRHPLEAHQPVAALIRLVTSRQPR